MNGQEQGNNAQVDQIMENVELIQQGEARLNITWRNQQNGDMPDPVPFDATDEQIKQWATEQIRNGGIPGIEADAAADFTDYRVDRIPAKDGLPNRMMLRPKTAFGA